MKKIYILADMEGISGIRYMAQVQSGTPDYEEGRRLMMQDINAAVHGAARGGATLIVVADTHGGGGQLRLEEMDERAVCEMPGSGKPMPSLDETYSGVILLGHHARAGTLNGFLDHTMNSSSWFEFRINDSVVGEIGIEAAYAGHFGVPIIMVSGDEATAREARETLGEVATVVVKWGQGRNKARCLAPAAARRLIADTAEQAVLGSAGFGPFKPALPGQVQITFYRTDMAEEFAFRDGVERVDARTVRRGIASYDRIMTW